MQILERFRVRNPECDRLSEVCGDRMVPIQMATARSLQLPDRPAALTDSAVRGLTMHDYTTGCDRQAPEESEVFYDSLLRWKDVKEHFPGVAKGVIAEYCRLGGQIPYEAGYVYLMHAQGTSYYKIGKSINPDKRLLQISPKMPFETELIKVWGTNFMSIAEKWLHKHFSEFRRNGEWFQLPDEFLFHLLIGCDYEYTLTIRNAYIATINLGLSGEDLSSLNEALSEEVDWVSFGFARFGNSPYPVALLESWFHEIRMENDTSTFELEPPKWILDRLHEGWKKEFWL